MRDQIVADIEKKLLAFKNRKSRSYNNVVCELKSHSVYSKYVKELEDGQLQIEKAKIAEESHYDDKFLIETNDDTLSLHGVVVG